MKNKKMYQKYYKSIRRKVARLLYNNVLSISQFLTESYKFGFYAARITVMDLLLLGFCTKLSWYSNKGKLVAG